MDRLRLDESGMASAFQIRQSLVEWLAEVAEWAATKPWYSRLDVGGVNAVDACSSLLMTRLHELTQIYTKPRRRTNRFLRELGYAFPSLAAVVRTWPMVHAGRVWRSTNHNLASCGFIFFPTEYTDLQQQLPVVESLRNSGATLQFITSKGRILHQLAAASEKAIHPWSLGSARLIRARMAGARAAHRLERSLPKYLPGFPLPVPEHLVRKTVFDVLRGTIPLVHETVSSTQYALDLFHPAVIVVGNDLTVEGRVRARVAARSGIATAAIMHGIVSGEPLHRNHIVDAFLVHGDAARRTLVRQGIPMERIHVCGAPYLDAQPEQMGKVHPVVEKNLGFGIRPMVLLAISPPGHSHTYTHFVRIIAAVMRLSAVRPDVDFVAKLHRSDKEEYYEQVRATIPGSRLHVVPYGAFGLDLFDWLQGCKAVITTTSAAGVESMQMDVPVVTLDLQAEFDEVDYIDAGCTLHARTEEELAHNVDTAVQRGPDLERVLTRSRAFLRESFYHSKGQAAVYCARSLMDLARQQGDTGKSASTPLLP